MRLILSKDGIEIASFNSYLAYAMLFSCIPILEHGDYLVHLITNKGEKILYGEIKHISSSRDDYMVFMDLYNRDEDSNTSVFLSERLPE